MPYFLCRLASENGSVFSQSILAPSSDDCRRYFESEGLCVLSIKRDWKRFPLRSLLLQKKIKDRDFILINQELVALIKSGYPILKSIEIINSRVKNVHLKESLMKVEEEIRQGKSLSDAFAPFEKTFTKVFTASLMAGEQSGNLPATLSRFITYSRVIITTKSRIRSALIYPTLLLVFSFVLLGILINFVIPRFLDFYTDFEAELPFITRWLMSFAMGVRKAGLYLAFLLILAVIAYQWMKNKEKTAVLIDRIRLRIPYARIIWLESGISLFCRTLSLLLEAGISLLASVQIAAKAIPNKFLTLCLKNLPDSIRNGESLSDSLAKARFFPPLALDMIRIGETSANLEGMLTEVADVYDERVQVRIDTFVSLIEPVVIIFMGLIVAAMLLSVYLPIFNIIRVAR